MQFKEDIEPAKEFAKQLFESMIDQITLGPEFSEEQIKLIYSYISFHAKQFAEEQ